MTAPITNASANESPEMPIARTAVVTGAPTAEPTVLITLLTPLAAAISDGGTIEATNRAQTANHTPFPDPTRDKNATIATTELGQIASPTAPAALRDNAKTAGTRGPNRRASDGV